MRARILVALLALGVGIAVLAAVREPDLLAGLACLAPAAVAFLTLRAGHYPAERALIRISRMRPRRAFGRGRLVTPTRAHRLPPRGGRLVGAAIAGRSPPARPAAAFAAR